MAYYPELVETDSIGAARVRNALNCYWVVVVGSDSSAVAD